MFNWFYKRISNAVIENLQEWLQEPKNIEELTKLVDALFDRELKRLMSSLGGAQKSGAEQPTEIGGIDIQKLLTGKGGISSKKLIGMGLQWWMDRQKGEQGSNQGGLP